MRRPIEPRTWSFAASGALFFVLLVAVPTSRISVDFSFALPVLIVVAAFFLLSIRYRRLGDDHLVAALQGSALLMYFSSAFMLATYLMPEHAPWGLWDEQFAAFDAALGVTADDVVKWSRATPWFDGLLASFYSWFYYHYALVVLWAAGVRRAPRRAYLVLGDMFTAALFGLALFMLFPALNAVWFYGHEDLYDTATLVQHVQMLEAGTFERFTMQGAQGLVQFPSFHVALAVVLWWDLRNEHRVVFGIGTVWTALVLLSAVTTGGHYLIDVWAGIALAAGSIALVRWACGPVKTAVADLGVLDET